jgi:hypothetical protein
MDIGIIKFEKKRNKNLNGKSPLVKDFLLDLFRFQFYIGSIHSDVAILWMQYQIYPHLKNEGLK